MALIKAVIKKLYLEESNQTLPKKSVNSIKDVTSNMKKYLNKHQFLAWSIRIFLTATVAALLWALIHCYNDYAKLLTRAQAYSAQIGVELKRRNNLIPSLVIMVKQYAVHEEEIFKHISDAREMFVRAKGGKQKMQAAFGLDAALSKLLAIVEQYPDLKATRSIQDLIKELSGTEDRIAKQKERYNEIARHYNQLLSTFPTNILGMIYGFGQKMPYVGIEEEVLKMPEISSEWGKNSIDRLKKLPIRKKALQKRKKGTRKK